MTMVRETVHIETTRVAGCIFDFGGVMTAPDDRGPLTDPHLEGLRQFYVSECQQHYHRHGVDHDLHRLEVGEISLDDYFSGLCARFAAKGHPLIEPGLAQRSIFYGFSLCTEMAHAVRTVHERGYKTALLTNMGKEEPPLWQRMLGDDVEALFDTVIDSSRVGQRKPNPRIYELAARALDVDPANCLFVDDLECNVDGARTAGMQAVRCLNPLQLAPWIIETLVTPATETTSHPSH